MHVRRSDENLSETFGAAKARSMSWTLAVTGLPKLSKAEPAGGSWPMAALFQTPALVAESSRSIHCVASDRDTHHQKERLGGSGRRVAQLAAPAAVCKAASTADALLQNTQAVAGKLLQLRGVGAAEGDV